MEFVRTCQTILFELYDGGLNLPHTNVSDDDGSLSLSHIQWRAVFGALNDYLREWGMYFDVYDPYTHSEPTTGSLADDLADIYRDLKNGLNLFDSSADHGQLKAVYAWRLSFYSHWGKHLTDAMRPLHRLREKTFFDEIGS